jgi:hypothetical protein
VRNLPGVGPPKFTFQLCPKLKALGVDVARDDILQNFTISETLSMNKGIPWRGAREKDPRFMQMFIEALSIPGDVVVDCTASTSKS